VSASGAGATSGVLFGLVAVLLAQQLGFADLSALSGGLTLLVGASVGFGLLFALAGWALGRRYARRHPEGPRGADPTSPTEPPDSKVPPSS
jgi:hypothetical protein